MRHRFRYLPKNALFWVLDDTGIGGGAGPVPSNKGTLATQIDKRASDANATRDFVPGKYNDAARMNVIGGTPFWGNLHGAAPALDDGSGNLVTFGYWGPPANTGYYLLIGWGFLKISAVGGGRIYVDTDAGSFFRGIPAAAGNRSRVFKVWISGGFLWWRFWEDGVLVHSSGGTEACSSFVWAGGATLLYFQPGQTAIMDELWWAQGWDASDDEVLELSLAPTIQDRTVIPIFF